MFCDIEMATLEELEKLLKGFSKHKIRKVTLEHARLLSCLHNTPSFSIQETGKNYDMSSTAIVLGFLYEQGKKEGYSGRMLLEFVKKETIDFFEAVKYRHHILKTQQPLECDINKVSTFRDEHYGQTREW